MFSKLIYEKVNPVLSKFGKCVIKHRVEDLAWQRSLILDKSGVSFVIDIGAHKGEFYHEIRRNGFRDGILSIEPTLSSFEFLKRIENSDQKFKSLNIALSNKFGEVEINEFQESTMNSILDVNQNSSYDLSPSIATSKVKCMTLDQLIKSESLENEVLFIKLDVQGFELRILDGLRAFLTSVKVLQVEISINPIYKDASNLADFVTWLESNGYKIASISTERFHESVAYAYDVDILCVRN